MKYPIGLSTAIHFLVSSILGATSCNAQLSQGNLRFEQGLYREAIAQYECALPLAQSLESRAVICIAWLSRMENWQFAAAEHYYGDALSIFRAQHDSPRIALSLAGLAEIYRAEHRFDGSRHRTELFPASETRRHGGKNRPLPF